MKKVVDLSVHVDWRTRINDPRWRWWTR